MQQRFNKMELKSILIILVLGAVVGWLAGLIVRGGGFGLIVNIVVGILGAFVGKYIFAQLGVAVGSGLTATLVSATVGAVILVVAISLIEKAGELNASYGPVACF